MYSPDPTKKANIKWSPKSAFSKYKKTQQDENKNKCQIITCTVS